MLMSYADALAAVVIYYSNDKNSLFLNISNSLLCVLYSLFIYSTDLLGADVIFSVSSVF